MAIKQNKIPDDTFNIEVFYRKSFVFVLNVIEYAEILKHRDKQSMAVNINQSATLWGKYINEARNVESAGSLKYKLNKALHEADKLKYFFNLCRFSKNYPYPDKLINELEELTQQINLT